MKRFKKHKENRQWLTACIQGNIHTQAGRQADKKQAEKQTDGQAGRHAEKGKKR